MASAAAMPPSCARDSRRKFSRPRWPSASSCAVKPSLQRARQLLAERRLDLGPVLRREDRAGRARSNSASCGFQSTPAVARRTTGPRSRGCASTGASCRPGRAGSWPSSAPGSRRRGPTAARGRRTSMVAFCLSGVAQHQRAGGTAPRSGCGTRVKGAAPRQSPKAACSAVRTAAASMSPPAANSPLRGAVEAARGSRAACSSVDRVHVRHHLVEASRA